MPLPKVQNSAEQQLHAAVQRLQQSVGAIRALVLVKALIATINAEKTQEHATNDSRQRDHAEN